MDALTRVLAAALLLVSCGGDSFAPSGPRAARGPDGGDDGSRTYESDASPTLQKFDARAPQDGSDEKSDDASRDSDASSTYDAAPSSGGASSTYNDAASSGGASSTDASSPSSGGATTYVDASPSSGGASSTQCTPGHIEACSTCGGGWPPCCYQGTRCGCFFPLGCGLP